MRQGYALDNSWDRARRRLSLLEQYLDPMTRRRMSALGLREGWQCLEIAAGGGSIAGWLGEQVGATGSVLATDINVALLETVRSANVRTQQHDILRDPLPEDAFDLVHSRWLLHHLRDPETAIHRMVSAARPGGWVLIEEVDFFPVHASSSAAYREFMTALVNTVVEASGRDCFWARALPEIVAAMDVEEIGGEGDFSIFPGGSPVAEFFALTAEQMRERLVQAGAIDANTFERALKLLASPNFWGFGGGGVSLWARRTGVRH
jgi:ubiquinone/menaquinone biosynthesis C-methylase UbiE